MDNSLMTKILIITYDFPPYNSIAGQRTFAWFRYFHEFGIFPVVITRHWNNNISNEKDYLQASDIQITTIEEDEKGKIIRLPYNPNKRDQIIINKGSSGSFLRKAYSLVYSSRYRTFKTDHTDNIFKKADEYLSENDCDCIIASGEPFILFRYASILADKYKTPWIADYRDTWSTNHHAYSSSFLKKLNGRLLVEPMEKRLIANSLMITTTSPAYRENLLELHKGKRIEVVFNGYFEEQFINLKSCKQGGETFQIAYSGTIYPYQKLEIFLDGFRKFLKEKNYPENVSLSFYGAEFWPEQQNRIRSFDKDLNKYICTTPRLSKEKLLEKLCRSNLMLLLADSNRSQPYAKIFEYLALNRKIMMVENDHDIIEKIINETNSGIACDEPDNVKDSLIIMYDEFCKNGKVENNTTNHEQYTRKNQTKKFAEILKSI